jgi:hypothetical protein
VIDLIQPSSRIVYVGGNVVVDVLEIRVVLEVGDVLGAPGAQVVHADHAIAFFEEEPLAQVAPDEPRPPVTSARFFSLLSTAEAAVQQSRRGGGFGVEGVASVHE